MVGDVLKYVAFTGYVKAQADTSINAEVIGMVGVVIDANNFTLITNGYVTGLSGLTAGQVRFLDPVTAGATTSTEPTTSGQVSKPVFIPASATTGYFYNFRGIVLGATAQAANTFYAGPTTGASAAPTFRTVVGEDLATGTPTAGKSIVAAGAGVEPLWGSPGPAGVGFLSGKDRDRPAANNGVTNQWGANDTYQTYWTDGSNWFNAFAGWDKTTHESAAGGFSDTIYIAGNVGAATGFPWSTNQTLLLLFKVNSLPGTGGGVIATYSNGTTTGWFVANSTTVSNGLRVLMTGVNSTGNIALTGITLTTGVHCLAIKYTGTTLDYSYDGGAVQTVAVSGTYTPPGASAAPFIGRWSNAGVSANWFSIGIIQGYNAALSSGDLIIAAGNSANYLAGNVSTDPLYDWQSRWVPSGGLGSGASTGMWYLQCYGTGKTKLTTLGLLGGVVKNFW